MRNFYIGNGSGSKRYSGYFETNEEFVKYNDRDGTWHNSVDVDFRWRYHGGGSVSGYVEVYFRDGTVEKTNVEGSVSGQGDYDETVTVSVPLNYRPYTKIRFGIEGSDVDYAWSGGSITSIIFNW